MWFLKSNLPAVDLPLPLVPRIIILALLRLNSFLIWYKNWLNKTTPPEKSIPNKVDLPGSLIESNTKGYIAATVGAGTGIPILLSTSCLGNIGIIDFKTFSCSNIIGIARIPKDVKKFFICIFFESSSSCVSAIIMICIWKSNIFDWVAASIETKFSIDS